jgi:hypothetical protein
MSVIYYSALSNTLSRRNRDDGPTLEISVSLGNGLNLITVDALTYTVAVTTFTNREKAYKAAYAAHKAGLASLMIMNLEGFDR